MGSFQSRQLHKQRLSYTTEIFMEKSLLVQLLQDLTAVEKREARKFLISPFFNQRADLVRLFDFLLDEKTENSPELAHRAATDRPDFDAQESRLLLSYLHRLLEQFLALKNFLAEKNQVELHLAIAYRKRGMTPAFHRTRKNLQNTLEKQPRRDADFHRTQHDLAWQEQYLATSADPTDAVRLRELSAQLDLEFISKKLHHRCLELAHAQVYQSDFQEDVEEVLLAWAERRGWSEQPAVSVWATCFRMLREPSEATHFQNFKRRLLENGKFFSVEELRNPFLMAINHAVRRANEGGREWFREVFDLYRFGLENGFLFENGELSRFAYHNIAAAALQNGELDWAKNFIQNYRTYLARQYRDSSFSFNLARLEFTQKNYAAVLDLLQKANYRDPLLNLSAKTLLLKTWYELGETDPLAAHLDAMRNYIHRKRVIGYHRTNYLNIARFTDKLLKINFLDKSEIERLRSAVASEEHLTEREWFLERLNFESV